jgi:hypothetical protein
MIHSLYEAPLKRRRLVVAKLYAATDDDDDDDVSNDDDDDSGKFDCFVSCRQFQVNGLASKGTSWLNGSITKWSLAY